ncbi:MAG: phosphodiester glycosidase family protein [Clostridia bacterium]|nr:phosphodiester glycosidase family protein [Clostridia bacterium]
MKKPFSRILSMLLVAIMVISVLPLNLFALDANYDTSNGGSDYYQIITQRDWELAPGVLETEMVLNNDAGTRRQVVHTLAVDVNNPYTRVIAGYKGMWPEEGNYGTQSTSVQALEAEKLGYGNVVAATNTTLSWYTADYYKKNPHLIGEPLGYTILDGERYANSSWTFDETTQKYTYNAADTTKTVIVINYDNHPITGEERPADMPKVWIRSTQDPLTGWEEQAIPVSFDFLVKPDANGKPAITSYGQSGAHGSGIASRTFVGVKADGTLLIVVSDGEQAPYSTGFTQFEMADYMINMGCVIAANCDGGGSTTFCTQRPGEDFKVNCSLADGGERPTTSTILVISDAPADGVFARATISSDYDYYTPGSSVSFSALGTDAVGTKVDIPADVEWQIKEEGMGTIENGVFTSNGTEGKVTAQMVYDGKVVGEHSVNIAAPEALSFEQPVVTIPFGKTAIVPVKATVGDGVYEIGLGSNDVTFTTNNSTLGSFSGLNFTAVDEANAPADLTSTVTATYNANPELTATVQLNIGKGSEVLWDFEDGQTDIDEWNVINSRTNDYRDYYLKLSLADRTNGQVHDGDYSMRLNINGLSSKKSDSSEYAWIRLGVDGDAVILENARRVGFWLYVPEDNIQCWVQGHYMTDSNGDGTYDTLATVSMMESENVYYNIDESGWHYMSMDISDFEKVALKYSNQFNKQDADGQTTGQLTEKGEFFLAIVTHRTKNNLLWQTNGTINGPYTYYLDSFTVDYSEAVDDRENPVFDKIYVDGTTPLVKREVVTLTNNTLNLSAAVADATTLPDAMGVDQPLYNVSGLNADTAKVYIDGVEVASTFANGVISANNLTVADGYHRIKFEICDNMGNKSVIIRVVKVEGGSTASTLKLVPADATLDRIPYGSIYWMNLEATNIETIQKVETVIDLNSVNHWQLDHMELAQDFTAEYTIDEETNTATITFTRTDINAQTGAAVLAKIPVRILYFDTDIKVPGFTAQTYWTTYNFFPQDMKMDVDMGLITHTNGKTSTFSNEEFHVDTETYTSNAAMDKTYFAEHGTTHVHTPVALEDKAATCAEVGYTGRTFCEGCNSVVEWGTTIPMTEHVYKIVDDTIACDCGKVKMTTGLETIDGKSYYLVNGKLNSGWMTIAEEWYYFDTTTYASVDTLYNGYVTYEFYPDGKLVSGQWYHSDAGHKYYEGPSFLRGGKSCMTWYTIDGKDYLFDKTGYVMTGTRWVNDQNDGSDTFYWYNFDEYGVSQGRYYGNGLHEWNGNLYYLKDGINQYGMYKVDGEYYYFYFTNYRCAIKNQSFYCGYTKGLMPVGTYAFDVDGKMLNNEYYVIDGKLSYFVNGQPNQGPGTVTVDGDYWDIDANGTVLYTGLLEDALGNLIYFENGVQTEWVKNGVIRDNDGEVRYYVDGVATRAGLVRDMNGNYYYINSSMVAVKNCTYSFNAEMSNGLLPAGTYQFGADGKMIDPPYVECAEHTWRKWVIVTPATYTADGLRQRECRLCDVVETEVIPKVECTEHVWGEWVVTTPPTYTETGIETRTCTLCSFAETQVAPVKVCTHTWGFWVVMTPATTTSTGVESRGCTECGESQTQEIPVLASDVKNGIMKDANGDVRCYVDGKATRAGLVRDNDGYFYYINSSLKAVKNCSYSFNAAMSNGLLPAGTYKFDAQGRMIDPPVAECNAHFLGNWVVTTPATETTTGVELGTCYYCHATDTREIPVLEHVHVWGEWVVTTPATEDTTGVETRTCACNETETREIPKLPHTHVWGEWTETVPATYTSVGEESRTCPKCGETETREIPMLVCTHTWGAWVVTTPATENSTGVETRTCDVCGATETQTIPMLDHTHVWGEWVVTTPASYTAAGVETKTCAGCGETETREIPKLVCTEHAWGEWVVTTEPTYTTEGVETKTCANCGATETQSVPKLDPPPCTHVWGDWIVMTEATTTTAGVEARGCTECGATESQDIPVVDPNAVKNGVMKDANGDIRYYENGAAVKSKGLVKYNGDFYYINSTSKAVKNCTYSFNAARANGLLPAGTYKFDATGKMIDPPVADCNAHFWGAWVIITDATETESGLQTRDCYYCNATDTEEIPAINVCAHDWSAWVVTTPATETANGTETRTCTLCGETETRIIPMLEHTHVWGDWTVTTEPTYTTAGVETRTCAGCGMSETNTIPMLVCTEHVWGDWVVTKEPTYTETGVETRTCGNCGATETQTIAKVPSDLKQGLVWDADGNIRYYVDGVAVKSKGLVQDDEGNYYYINSTSKAVKNCTYSFSAARANGLLPAGTYQFDAEGRLILK